MNRTRDYYRKQRARAIKRKKRIAKVYRGIRGYYPSDGYYSKRKVHCSCGMCRVRDHKGGHLLTLPEIFAMERMVSELKEWGEGSAS